MNWYKCKKAGMRESAIRHLMVGVGSFDDIYKYDHHQLIKYFKLEPKEADILDNIDKIDISKDIDELTRNHVKVINITSKDYPEDLKNIGNPPAFLYYKGNIDLLKHRKIAIVGTRKATSYGKVACEKIVDGLVDAGITTVSGLALGIDTICHKRTLERGGHTIAIVGSGLDVIYPRVNRKIWDEIAENHLIMSEYPLGTEPTNFNFPMRNRIIVGISKGVAIIESQVRGGSLISATIAVEEGRDVFAVPGDMFSPSSQGCNDLIKRSQAKLITTAQDILDEYNWVSSTSSEYILPEMDRDASKIYGELAREKTLDELVLATNIEASKILMILMDLEIKNVIMSGGGGKYRRKF